MEENTEQEKLNDFYFLIFTANPTRDNVKIWVDGDKLTMVMKRDKFYNIIEKLIDYDTASSVHLACTTYGCFYQLDRFKKTVQKLHPASIEQHLNPSEDFMKSYKENEKKQNDLSGQYQNSINDWMDQGIKNTPYINKRDPLDHGTENRIK